MRLALLSSPADPSACAVSPGSARSLTNAIRLPSGLHAGEDSPPICVRGRSPPAAVQIHRSCRNELFFQSRVSVPMTADDASGDRAVDVMNVVLKYSSSVMGGWLDWITATEHDSAAIADAMHREWGRIRAI